MSPPGFHAHDRIRAAHQPTALDDFADAIERLREEGRRQRAEEPLEFDLQISPSLSRAIAQIARDASIEPGEVLKSAINLLRVAHQAKKHGQRLGITSDPGKLEMEIVGLP